MRLAARKDANKDGIVKALREAGFMVYDLKQPVDILVWDKGSNWTLLMELKDGNKPPSARGLTDAQVKVMEQGLPFCIVTDAEGALRAAMVMRNVALTGSQHDGR